LDGALRCPDFPLPREGQRQGEPARQKYAKNENNRPSAAGFLRLHSIFVSKIENIPLMDFQQVIEARRSVRKFRDEEVPHEVLAQAIEAALHAPSSRNSRSTRFLAVRDF